VEGVGKLGRKSDRDLLRNAPPVTMVFITPSGQLLHGKCGRVLKIHGSAANKMGRRELQSFCLACIEHVILPEDMFPRISLCEEAGDTLVAS